eukprot:CAMPEP_0172406322 /NCGR_PEP_ID=MMETSP1061-20121228/70280_1 /TAXON_ID=37318 /ORGANISM="Pseudo-nitzschia pungens, Strain cf. pungens" /LENGTH=43 /DNA_ID= /DNA_START= /DNA_END= /DNA_ORIENTATION=
MLFMEIGLSLIRISSRIQIVLALGGRSDVTTLQRLNEDDDDDD